MAACTPTEPSVICATMREDYVQNAYSFLRHPNVIGTPLANKIAFLKEKGLTDEEIQEAFNRVDKVPTPYF